MTSDLCTEDVVVHITAPQILTTQTIVSASAGGGGGGGAGAAGAAGVAGVGGAAGAAGARVAASSAAVELGRRLLLAARAGDTQQVLDLMAKGAPFTTDWLGTSPLHLAAGNAHAETCAVLLRAGVSRDARTKVERTPLHLAACGGHARVARLLLDAGAAADPRDLLRMTPLHWAVQRGHAAAAGELLRRGADPQAVSKFHKTPLSLAAELRRDDLLRLIDDALKEREAARSVDALVNEQMADSPPAEPQTFDAVQRIQDIKPTKPKQTERMIKTDIKTEASTPTATTAAQILRKHGITLLPTDDGSTVLSALQSGRTVVLSDAGKLMLKESESSPSAAPKTTSAQAKGGMVLTATPVRSPPRPGVKIFTLNNKLLAVPRDHHNIPVKKIINPQDMQVKFVQLPPDAKIISPSKIVPMKAKNRLAARPLIVTPTPTPTPGPAPGPDRPAVKIIMNKNNFNRLMATATRTTDHNGSQVISAENDDEDVVGEVGDDSPAALRAQLAAARRALCAARRELSDTRARLAQLERLHQL